VTTSDDAERFPGGGIGTGGCAAQSQHEHEHHCPHDSNDHKDHDFTPFTAGPDVIDDVRRLPAEVALGGFAEA
jgi:hypothetical protein